MILVDTSVVIGYLRSADPAVLALFIARDAAICGISRARVLHGAQSPRDRANLIRSLDGFGQLAIPEALWDEVGDNLVTLRRRGVNVPFADFVVATAAVYYDIELWSLDKHFALVQRVLPALRLFRPPP